MKKRVMIYVEEESWLDVRLKTVRLGISAGDYLMDLHKKSETVINPEIVTKEIFPIDVLKVIPDTEVEFISDDITKSAVIDEAQRKEILTQDWRNGIQSRPKGQDGKK